MWETFSTNGITPSTQIPYDDYETEQQTHRWISQGDEVALKCKYKDTEETEDRMLDQLI